MEERSFTAIPAATLCRRRKAMMKTPITQLTGRPSAVHHNPYVLAYASCKSQSNVSSHPLLVWHVFGVDAFPLGSLCLAGIGYASFVIVSLLNIYYIVILAWGLYYLLQCFQPELPWAKCKQPWNTEHCVEDTVRKNQSLWLAANVTNFTSPVTEFWE